MTGISREQPAMMTTRVETGFGDFEVPADDILTFPTGLPGFERCRRFVLLSAETLTPFQCLQSIEGPPASFLVIDPRLVLATYRAVLSTVDCIRLGVAPDATLLWLAIVTPGDDDSHPHVNLRAPIVINPQTMVGYQLMPSNSLYPLRHPLGVE
jgi:flagellar assembly factor FliW